MTGKELHEDFVKHLREIIQGVEPYRGALATVRAFAQALSEEGKDASERGYHARARVYGDAAKKLQEMTNFPEMSVVKD